MANATPSRLGQTDGTGGAFATDNELFLEIYGGMVLTAYNNAEVTRDKHRVRTITQGI